MSRINKAVCALNNAIRLGEDFADASYSISYDHNINYQRLILAYDEQFVKR